MKTNFAYFFLIVSLLIQIQCRTPKGEKNPRPEDLGVCKITVDINSRKYSGISVAILDKKEITDQSGKVDFEIPKKIFDSDQNIRIIFANFQINKAPLRTIKDTINISIDSKEELSFFLNNLLDSLREQEKQLIGSEDTLNSINGDLQKYTTNHEGSALEEFGPIMKYRALQIDSILGNSKKLKKSFETAIMNLDLTKLGRINVANLRTGYVKFVESSQKAIDKVNLLRVTYRANRNEQDKIKSFRTDVYFESGEYEIKKNRPDSLGDINNFIKNINRVKNEILKFENSENELKLRIKSLGYTDGQPCGDSIISKIRPYCPVGANVSADDGNKCLSTLRAKEIYKMVANRLEVEKFPLKIDTYFARGFGSVRAKGSKEPNAELRKCELSFVIIPESCLLEEQKK